MRIHLYDKQQNQFTEQSLRPVSSYQDIGTGCAQSTLGGAAARPRRACARAAPRPRGYHLSEGTELPTSGTRWPRIVGT